MKEDTAIKVKGLGKRFTISHRASKQSDTLRDSIAYGVSRVTRSMGDLLNGRPLSGGDIVEEFWALRDLNFEIARGDTVGIIGRNGAGKSTLLKILSRITRPSEGRVEINGRVASLLEVGTGFHPELTGRENIFLNGAILGMSRDEIRAKFDDIVDFSGVERFLDTPVKRYSSGMYVRLAFAVAAHLEPEILIVDEVLAVGDAAFQRKCLGKMQDVASEGRTVLFVSHNIGAIKRLCRSGIVLDGGTAVFCGPVNQAIEKYSEADTSSSSGFSRGKVAHPGIIEFNSVDVSQVGDALSAIEVGSGARIRLGLNCHEAVEECNFTVQLHDEQGDVLARFSTNETGRPYKLSPGTYEMLVSIEELPIVPGVYSILLAASRPPNFEHFDYIERACDLTIIESDIFGTGRLPTNGRLVLRHDWSLHSLSGKN